ncbi:intracellular protease, PfpI family protein [Collimonas fungivorans]|uniref:Intracellular protease, PfpI family protein n=2 Tax=Collimonas fungivorans TaxID=158899 RepID=A0A127PBA6_9BURK|nr:intracellular protease, PfpI family protein [Collimonas fungivorans]
MSAVKRNEKAWQHSCRSRERRQPAGARLSTHLQGTSMSANSANDKQQKNVRSGKHDSPDEITLDDANEMSFPASDPVASSNITRIAVAPDMAAAAADHQNSNAVAGAVDSGKPRASSLRHMNIAILVTDGFEQAELLDPKKALEEAGATVHVVSDKSESVQGYLHTEKAMRVSVDKALAKVLPEDYAAVLLPGGVVNGDALRMSPQARGFVQSINKADKPIASICHGGWLLISAGIAKDRTVTSWPSLQDDFRNAGSTWLDQEVVRDRNFVSSRKPDDLPAFNLAFISLLREQQRTSSDSR